MTTFLQSFAGKHWDRHSSGRGEGAYMMCVWERVCLAQLCSERHGSECVTPPAHGGQMTPEVLRGGPVL